MTRVQISPSASNPKPVQTPHPPVIMGGGGGPVTFRHIVEYCDGWMPIHGRTDPLEKLPLLRQMCEQAGRDPDSISISVFGVPPDRETIDKLADAGVQRAVFGLPPAPRNVVEPLLDRYAELIG